MTTQFTLKQASKMFQIYPRSQKSLTAWQIANILVSVPYQAKIAAQGIEWSLRTGRLSGGVEMAIRKMSTYQTLKVLVNVVNNTETMNDVPRWLNQNVEA